jgi:halimadienyl-diphosphate synthase
VYSLEFLGRSADPEKLSEALSPNGALGNSPATTAYYLLLSDPKNAASVAYLEEVRKRERIVTVYPFRVFELSWVLNNLLFSGLPITEFATKSEFDYLAQALSGEGAALDPTFGVTDGDITSVCCHVLLNAGYDIDPSILSHFENPDTRIFRTYSYERNVSNSTNIHALDALRLMDSYPDVSSVREQVSLKLLDNRKYNIFWIDKWHASPYYATAHALVGLLKEKVFFVHACRHTVAWLLHTQRSDGSWGFFQKGTLEETAYVLTALLYYSQYEPIEAGVLHRAASYLLQGYVGENTSFPELWLAKSIYAPHDIVRSAILAALILYEATV